VPLLVRCKIAHCFGLRLRRRWLREKRVTNDATKNKMSSHHVRAYPKKGSILTAATKQKKGRHTSASQSGSHSHLKDILNMQEGRGGVASRPIVAYGLTFFMTGWAAALTVSVSCEGAEEIRNNEEWCPPCG
jgi:hypothetical protein